MHIPDGYLGPKTCGIFYLSMVPVWYLASVRIKKTLGFRYLPFLALASAFTFIIMMFNFPIPGGATGHMVGGTVVSIVLGPWAGVVAMSLTLSLQALLFGDGGITSLGANSFNMAFLMSFTGYYTYLLITSRSASPLRQTIACAIAGYLSVNITALAVAFELGIQPMIAHASDGTPLYAPYPLSITIPAMMIPHLLFLGPVEAFGTALVVSYIRKREDLVFHRHKEDLHLAPLYRVLIFLVLLTPLGLLAQGVPWGEWDIEGLKSLTGYVPSGMERLNSLWSGIMPDYTIPGLHSDTGSAIGYVISALVGSVTVIGLVYLWGKVWHQR